MERQLTFQTFSDPEHDEYLQKLKDEVLEQCKQKGEHHGYDNMPMTYEDFKALCLNDIEAKIQTAIYKNHERYLSYSGIATARKIQEDCDREVNALTLQIRSKEPNLKKLIRERDELQDRLVNNKWRPIVHVCLAGVSISEGWMSYPGFRYAHFPLVAAASAAAGVAIGAFLGAIFLSEWISKSKSKPQFYKRYAISLAPAVAVFSSLGYLRAYAYNHASETYITKVHSLGVPHGASGTTVALVSITLYWLSLFLGTQVCKTETQKKLEQDYDTACKKVVKAQKEIDTLKGEIKVLKDTSDKECANALASFEHAGACERGLISFARVAAEAYKDTNIQFRPDRIVLPFYSEVPQFNFKTFYVISKNNNNETDYSSPDDAEYSVLQ